MTRDQKKRIEEYIVMFKNFLAPYLKPTVAVETTVYPFLQGVVLRFQLNFEAKTETLFKKEVQHLKDLIQKYRLDLNGVSTGDALRKHTIIFKGNTILSVKGYDPEQWNEERAKTIVTNIVKIIGEKICQSS